MENIVGSAINEKRLEIGLSINELARLSGVDRTTISKIESGETKNPLIITLNKIFGVLDMDIFDVIDSCKSESCNIPFYSEIKENNNNTEKGLYQTFYKYKICISGTGFQTGRTKNELIKNILLEINHLADLIINNESLDNSDLMIDNECELAYKIVDIDE